MATSESYLETLMRARQAELGIARDSVLERVMRGRDIRRALDRGMGLGR
jgi:hypothetical protein